MKETNKNILKLAIVCIAMQDSGNGATSPAIGTIMAAMPDVPAYLVQAIATVPSLLLALTPLLYAKLVDLGVRKRTILYWGAVTFVIGGVGPFFLHSSIWIILLFRAITGFGCGFCMTLSTDLVIDYFEGDERNTMQGFVSAIVGISGVMFQMLGGYLAGIRWDYTFLAYFVAIIFLTIAIIFLKEPDRKAKIAAQEGITDIKQRARLTGPAYLVAFVFALYFFFWFVIPTNGAMVLIMDGMATPAQIGGVFSLITASSFLVSVTFGIVYKKIKFNFYWISYVLGAAGLYLMYVTHSLSMFSLGIVLFGLSLGAQVPVTITKVTQLVPYSAGAAAIALCYAAMGIGGFVQPFIFKFFGPFAIGRPTFLLSAIAFIVLGVIMVVVNKVTPTKNVSTENVAAK
ncbi:MFS transporter [Dehalobacter sp. DCM]|uniref:MFS transporter n=1 Tax=Dehalobacter sp. DCM TaxID=2907827 RepID=UPI003081FFB5|nr:MFS transporter [Dehalobacter sp. DCM]